MAEKKWTPGPWHVGMRSGNNANTVYSYDGEDLHHDSGICSVYGIPLHVDVDEAEGSRGLNNAHLIAAAPEVYEVARAALDYIDAIPDEIDLPAMPGFDRDWADSVMAKARGESQ